MRTLKKTLALILVVAMVLSFGVIGASADFTDVPADHDYKEAIDVLSAIGVINGMTSTTFEPDGTLTRAQAAKIIAYLKLGSTNADLISNATTQKFSDVPTNHWAAGYIEYCANLGIINGVGDNKFNPEGKLTVAAFTKLLLGAVGYEAGTENFVGESWAINVASMAVTAKVFDSRIVISDTKNITRSEACQLAFKALFAGMVTYKGGSNIEVNGITISSGATREPTNTTLAESVFNMGSDTGIVLANDYANMIADENKASKPIAYGYTTIGEVINAADYQNDSMRDTYKISTGSDLFGKKVNVYFNKTSGDAYGVIATDSNVAYTATAKMTEKQLSDALKSAGMTKGFDSRVAHISLDGENTQLGWFQTNTMANFANKTGNGKTVVFIDNDGDKSLDLIYISTPAFGTVQVTNIGATRTHGAYTQYTVGGHNYKVYTSVVDADSDIDTAFVTGTVSNGDHVLYTVVGSHVTIQPVSTISGVLSAISNNGTLTIDGQSYQQAAICGTLSISKNSQSFYVDPYGYILDSVVASTSGNYIYLVADGKESYILNGSTLDKSVVADGVLPDGTVVKASIAKVGAADASTSNVEAGLYSYTLNAKGAYVLTALTEQATNDKLEHSSPVVAKDKYANADTKFIIPNWTTENGETVFAGTVNVITGYANIADMTGVKGSYVDNDKNGIVEVVFVQNKTATYGGDYIYITGEYNDTLTGREYTTIVKGEKSSITVPTTATLDFGLYKSISADGTGTKAGNTTAGTPDGTSVQNKGGLLYLDGKYSGKTVADTTPVYVIDTVGNTVNTMTANAITAVLSGDIYVAYGVNETTAAIYILVK